MLTEYPEKGVLLTSAVESDGGNGFSALESPHVMPTGASQHHHSMRENALFPPPWCFAEESARRGESRYTPPCQFRGHGASAAMAFRAKLRLSVQTCSPPPKFAPFPPLFATLTLRCGGGGVGFSGPLGSSPSAIGGHPVCLIAVRVRLPPLVYCSEGGKTPSPLNERTMVHSGRAAPLGHQ